MNHRNAEIIAATVTTIACLLLLTLFAANQPKLELSKHKKMLWLLEHASHLENAAGNMEDRLVSDE